MNDKALKVLCTLATGTAIATSMQVIAIADSAQTSNSSYNSSVTGTITADVLNIRSNHNTSSNIIGKINYNTKVSILEISNGWYKIKYNNTTGWISGEYVKLDNNSNTVQASKNGIVTATALNVRSSGNTNSRIIGSLSKNAKVQIISTGNGWHKIKYNNTTGFVSAEYINTSSTNTNSGNGTNNNSSTDSTVKSTGFVNADALNVRSSGNTSSKIVGTLYKNSKVEILSTSNGWHKIKFKGGTAFVSSEFISKNSSSTDKNPGTGTVTPPEVTPPSHTVNGKVAIVNADALNVRSGAGTSHAIITTVRYGSKLPIISYTNGWYNVKVGNTNGYISGDYVTISDENQSSNPIVKETPLIQSNYTGDDIVSKAEEYLGVPYLWGGFTPVGFDCSGLVQYVYKQLGISLERSTYYQVHQGVIVDRKDLKPGDLIFFTTNDDDSNDISHVGIYKGNDLFIQSPKPGDCVRVSNLNSAYYSNRYYIAKRIIK